MGCKIDVSRLKAVISNFQWVKKRPIERPPTRRDTRSIGHFQHSRKTLLVSWPKRVSQEVRSKNYKESSKSAEKQKLFFIDPATARYGTTPVVAESQRKFNSILRYRVAYSFCESQFYLADRKYNSRRNMFTRTNFFQSENLIYCRGLIIAIFKRPCARNTSETKLRDITVCKTRCR